MKIQTWLAVKAATDMVRLVPIDAMGPDVFVKYFDCTAAVKAERVKTLVELYEALPMHESIDSLRFTLLRSEAGDEIKRRASGDGGAVK